jgi:hypothetical protein
VGLREGQTPCPDRMKSAGGAVIDFDNSRSGWTMIACPPNDIESVFQICLDWVVPFELCTVANARTICSGNSVVFHQIVEFYQSQN